tara:strand:- start:2487 stop:3122 length:636 start_codon:yes stop_codon:yes gene_type:complete
MALIKPEKKSSGSKYLGYCEVSLKEVNNRVNDTNEDGGKKFPWADIYLDVVLQPKDSDYTRNMQICGSFDREEGSSKIKADSSVLKRLYWFFDAIGFQGGINAEGAWEDEKGQPIEDIADVLSKYSSESYNYLTYIYKEADKKNPSKHWTRVHNKIVVNNPNGRKELESYITFMKNKNFLREVDPTAVNGSDTMIANSLDEVKDMFEGLPE